MYPNIEEIFYQVIESDDHDCFLHLMTKSSDREFREVAGAKGAEYADIEEVNAANCCAYEKAGFIYGFRTAIKLLAEAL